MLLVVTQGLDSAAQSQLFQRLLSAGICFHGYQQLSYMILSRVSPVTHSIGNCVKRVVVIVASVIAFQNPMSTQNAIGELCGCQAGACRDVYCTDVLGTPAYMWVQLYDSSCSLQPLL